MDAAAITSAAQAVHQELVRKLAEQARINRFRDQLRRARPEVASPEPDGSAIASCWPAWPGVAFPSPVRPGAVSAPGGHAQPDAGSWPSPRSFFALGSAATGGRAGPGLDGTADAPGVTAPGVTAAGGPAALHPPAAPA
jgi:hypothetical protein